MKLLAVAALWLAAAWCGFVALRMWQSVRKRRMEGDDQVQTLVAAALFAFGCALAVVLGFVRLLS